MPPKLATAALQLDIFEDSREVVLCNALAEAIVRGDLEAAISGLAALREEDTKGRTLDAAARLIEHLDEHRRDAPAGHLDAPEILRRRKALNEQVAPAARELFGPGNAAPWLATQWRELARRATALPWQPDLGDAHPAALYLQASAWELTVAAVERIASWRRIPQPLLWMTQARWRLRSSDDIGWPLLAESFWLATSRARALMAGLADPVLDKLGKRFEASLDPAGDEDWAWFPAWAAVEQPRLAGALAGAEAPAQLNAATGLKLVLALLRLERQGRHDEIIEQRKKLRALSQPLFTAYMKTR